MRLPSAIVLSGLVYGCISCGRTGSNQPSTNDPPGQQILAVVGSEHVTAAEFAVELSQRIPGFSERGATAEQQSQVLDELIRTKAALAKARAQGFDQRPEVRTLVEKLIVSRFLETEFAKWSGTNAPITENEITTYYQQHSKQFTVSRRVQAGVLQLKISSKAGPEQRAAIRNQAIELQQAAAGMSDADFARLVQQHSEDQATRYVGGDTGWLQSGGDSPHWPDEVAQAALKLTTPGQVAPVLETSNGFFIVRLNQSRESQVRPFNEVRDAIAFALEQTHRRELSRAFDAQLKSALGIQINQEVLNSINIPAAGLSALPPGQPGG